MTRPLLVQEKVDFYVWRSRIRVVISQYHQSLTNPELGYIMIWIKAYNWRILNNDNNVIGTYYIRTKTGSYDTLSKYYFFSNGIRRSYLEDMDRAYYDLMIGYNR